MLIRSLFKEAVAVEDVAEDAGGPVEAVEAAEKRTEAPETRKLDTIQFAFENLKIQREISKIYVKCAVKKQDLKYKILCN